MPVWPQCHNPLQWQTMWPPPLSSAIVNGILPDYSTLNWYKSNQIHIIRHTKWDWLRLFLLDLIHWKSISVCKWIYCVVKQLAVQQQRVVVDSKVHKLTKLVKERRKKHKNKNKNSNTNITNCNAALDKKVKCISVFFFALQMCNFPFGEESDWLAEWAN